MSLSNSNKDSLVLAIEQFEWRDKKHHSENAHPECGPFLGYFTVYQLVPVDKHQLSLNETEDKYLKTAKVGGLILQLFLPSLHKCSLSCAFRNFSFKTSQQPDVSGVLSMSPVTFTNHKKVVFFLLFHLHTPSSHTFLSYIC